MRITFAVAAILIVIALAIAVGTCRHALRNPAFPPEAEPQYRKGPTTRRFQ